MSMTRLAGPLAGALLLAWPALALDTPNERLSLGGLTVVHLVVDDLPADVAQQGRTRAGLQADVEARLRRAGLRVLSATEALKVAGRPTLHLRVELVPFGEARRESLRIRNDMTLVLFKFRFERLAECDCFGGDDMHEGPPL